MKKQIYYNIVFQKFESLCIFCQYPGATKLNSLENNLSTASR